jgi:hypothetical protein
MPAPRSVRGRTYHPAMAHRREAEELLMIEEADAWFEYLEATRGQTALRYREVAQKPRPEAALLACGDGYADEFDPHAARAPPVIGRP